jgi:hypothetical protein
MRAKPQARVVPRVEVLEQRVVLDGGLGDAALITLGDAVGRARQIRSVPLRLGADRLTPGASGRTLIEIEIQPTEGSPFKAARFALLGPLGKAIDVAKVARGRGVVGHAELAPGNYLLRVRGRGVTTGDFVVRARLAADLNGDRQVDQTDALILARRDKARARAALDLNRDGRVNGLDRRAMKRSLGAASQSITIQVANKTGNADGSHPQFSNQQIYVAIYGKVPSLQDPVHNPGGWAYFDSTGKANSLWGPSGALMVVPTFTLAHAPNGIEVPRSQTVVSGQVYFGIGSPPILQVNTGVTGINVTNGGSGYSAASPPSVVLSGGASATAAIGGGTVTALHLLEGGSGYTTAPTVRLVGGGGSGATATAKVSGGAVRSVTITAPGRGYTSAPTVVFQGGGGTGARADAVITGQVSQVVLQSQGSGVSGTPNVLLVGGGGIGAAASPLIASGAVTNIVVTNGGSAYTSNSSVTLTGGGGKGASAAITLAGGKVTSIAVQNAGSGYTSAPNVTLVGGGGSGATAKATVVGGKITGFTVMNPGANYTGAPAVLLSGGGGQGGSGGAVVTGAIGAINVTNPGSGYTAAPTVKMSGGTGASATALIGRTITAINVTNPGSGYTAPPAVFIGGGANATATATVSGGAVQSLTVTNTGNGYATAPKVTLVAANGSGARAAATVAVLGVAAPSPSNPTDPNNSVYWDFAEFTMNSATNPDNINADLSQVDIVGIPHTLQLVARDGAKSPVRGVYPARFDLTNAFNAYVAKQKQPQFLPLLNQTGVGNHGVMRLLAPSDFVLPRVGVANAPKLVNYYDAYIQQVFKIGNTVTYQVPTPAPTTPAAATASLNGSGVGSVSMSNVGGGYLFAPLVSFGGGGGTGAKGVANFDAGTGTVTGVTVTDPGSGYTSAPAVNLRSPSFTFNGTVTRLGAGGPIVYQFQRADGGDPTPFHVYSPLNPPSWTYPAAYASWMVLANGGVFSDSANQFPTDPARASLLANIENQLVSSMSRGVALTSGPFYPSGGTANWYAGFLHQKSVSVGGYAYGFAYDDQGGNSTDLSMDKPRKLLITLGWRTALATS